MCNHTCRKCHTPQPTSTASEAWNVGAFLATVGALLWLLSL